MIETNDRLDRRVFVLATMLATALSLLATAAPVAAAPVTADCATTLASAGNDDGAAFVADSGFTVYYDDTEPMPDSGVFLNDSAMHFRNVTLVSDGSASLRLVAGTGESTCYGAVDATATPVTIAPADGGTSVTIDGAVDSLSVGPATVDTGNATLAYEASSTWNVSIAVNESHGTDLDAENADSGSTLADGTVENGSLALTLPAGSHAIALASPPSGGGGSGPPASTDTPSPTPTSTEVPGGSDGDGPGTTTPSPESTDTPTTQSPPPSPTPTAATTGEQAGGGLAPGNDGGLPVVPILAVLILAALATAGLLRARGQ